MSLLFLASVIVKKQNKGFVIVKKIQTVKLLYYQNNPAYLNPSIEPKHSLYEDSNSNSARHVKIIIFSFQKRWEIFPYC